jgi:uncharacterized membrane protein YkvA (DUF1232 family)
MAKKLDILTQAILLLGFFLAVLLGIKYFMTKFDIIPDSIGPLGYIDDFVALFMLIYGLHWLYKRVKERLGGTKTGIFVFLDKWPLSKLLTTLDFWLVLAWIVGVVIYWKWMLDLIPDPTPGLGYVDDVLVAFAAFIPVYRIIRRRFAK